MIQGMEQLSCKERLIVQSGEEKAATFQYLKGAYQKDREGPFYMVRQRQDKVGWLQTGQE